MSSLLIKIKNMYNQSEHTFHIPVMGLAYTIDSPLKVARFGINSVVSIIEDRLIEMMRKHYYPVAGKKYFPIPHGESDYRAKRITDYLNLMDEILKQQIEKMKTESFEPDNDIFKYFEMLPDESKLKNKFNVMLQNNDLKSKMQQQQYLKTQIKPGRIDVNILTKTDRENKDENGNIIVDGSDAVAALRGYINSNLTNSAIVFSAGMNPRLYSYLEKFSAFDPDENFNFKKYVIVKVSDYRSAIIQGKFLAKKGIWVSEFRIESGLNCGGHAFATDGLLMGPILEEFKLKREELLNTIFEIYKPVIEKKTGFVFQCPSPIAVTVQGGIGTAGEDFFLRKFYNVSGTGWGTPFLLVPEATTVDQHTLSLLCNATEKDVVLSNNSPLGVRFYYLKGTTADKEKQQRIAAGKPGSPCTEKHLGFNTEFTTEPICTASHKYQKLKLEQIKKSDLSTEEIEKQSEEVLAKECLCVGLSNAAALSYNEQFLKTLKAVNVCPGPNISNFNKVVSLKQMTDHIYGRDNLISNPNRGHVFIAELKIYLNYLKESLLKNISNADPKKKLWSSAFLNNLKNAITYYKTIPAGFLDKPKDFFEGLLKVQSEIEQLQVAFVL